MTGGYVIDKQVGNTGGLGGVFGILHAINKGTIHVLVLNLHVLV
jgi:hypothetical protein